jgi:gamma-glutamylcyclotransferase (GGCT)/AIG2-like uncharacterized protein YtfP
MHVFTYGTLMFADVWQAVVGRPFATVGGRLPGFSIYRVRDAVFPGIIAAASEQAVHGLLYLDVDAESVARLDRFEDDFYQRQPVVIACDDGRQREAQAYLVPHENRAVLTDEPWSAESFMARGDLARFVANFAGFRRLSTEST